MSTNPLNDISRVYLEQVAAVEEGVRPTPVDKPLDKAAFKKRRRSLAGKEKSAEARGRGHEGKEWYNSGRTYSPDEAKRMRSKLDDEERRTRHRSAVDPDDDNDNNYSADKTKNPKKIRKQKAMGELGEARSIEHMRDRYLKDPKEVAKQRAKNIADRRKKRAALAHMEKQYAGMKAGIYSSYELEGEMIEEKKKKPARWWDDDGDGVGYEEGEVSGKFKRKKKVEESSKPNDGNLANNYPPYDRVTRGDVIAGALGKDQMGGKKKKVTKEEYSNWRDDLIEVAEIVNKDKNDEKITEKTVKNKIKINPNIGEAVEELGGTLLEMVEIDEFDFIVESVYDELLDEGYGEDDVEEALEYALTEAKVTFGHDTATPEKKRGSLLSAAKQKLASKVGSAKKAAKAAVARGARKVAKGALGVARKMEGGDKKPHTVERKPSTYRGAGAGQKERVSSGSYTPPTKKKAEKPSDPWEGSETTPPKAKKKKAAAPKAKTTKVSGGTAKAPAKKRKSKLDDLLASVRSEQVQIDEKTLTAAETKEKERLVKSMKDKSADFEKRYPGRGKEVMYATATKMAKKMAEQAMEIQPKTEKPEQNDQQQKKIAQQKDRQRQQEVQILNRKLQALRSAPKGTDTDVTV